MKIEKILEQRGKSYGGFQDCCKTSQDLKKIMHECPSWKSLSDDKKESLEVITLKMARILNGDPEYKDSWDDIQGYAKLVADSLVAPKICKVCFYAYRPGTQCPQCNKGKLSCLKK